MSFFILNTPYEIAQSSNTICIHHGLVSVCAYFRNENKTLKYPVLMFSIYIAAIQHQELSELNDDFCCNAIYLVGKE